MYQPKYLSSGGKKKINNYIDYNHFKWFIKHSDMFPGFAHIEFRDPEDSAPDQFLLLDGEWHPVSNYLQIVDRIEYRLAQGFNIDYYKRRGDGFCLMEPDEEPASL